MINEKVLVHEDTHGHSEMWLLEDLYEYIVCNKEEDPLGILKNEVNQYAIGRAIVYGSRKERNEKYGREEKK